MVRVINNLWSIIKMVVVLLIMVIVMKFVGIGDLINAALVCLGLYVAVKMVDLGGEYLRMKMGKPADVAEEKSGDKDEINPEIIYIEGIINDIKKKTRKTANDKNTLDLLNFKLKQLKNI